MKNMEDFHLITDLNIDGIMDTNDDTVPIKPIFQFKTGKVPNLKLSISNTSLLERLDTRIENTKGTKISRTFK